MHHVDQRRTENDHASAGVRNSNSKSPAVVLLALISSGGTKDAEAATSPIPRTHVSPKNMVNRTLPASTCDRARALWILGTGAETATAAMSNLGLEPLPAPRTDEDKHWQTSNDAPNLQMFMSHMPGDKNNFKKPQSGLQCP
jgi:hypothetical protein